MICIRELLEASSGLVELPRREWLATLEKAQPLATDPVVALMIGDLILGSRNAGSDKVNCERKQVAIVCDLAEPLSGRLM